MTMKKKTAFAAIALAAVAAAAAWFAFSRRGAGPAPAQEPVDPVLERAADKEYEEKLLKLIGERDAIVKRLMAARKRLSDAEAAGAPGEELAALSNAVKAVAHEIEVNRGKAQLTVRERINGQRAAK